MKPKLTAQIGKYLQPYFQSQNSQIGMTEVDWLALIVLAVAAVVGIPYLLSGRSKPHHHLEARNIVGALNRAQQAYHLEQGNFTESIAELGLGMTNPTKNYHFSIRTTPLAVYNYGVPLDGNRTSYLGAVVLLPTENPPASGLITQAILCQTKEVEVKPFDPIVKDGILQCHSTMTDLGESGGISVGQDWEKTNRALELIAAEKYQEATEIAATVSNSDYQEKIRTTLETHQMKNLPE